MNLVLLMFSTCEEMKNQTFTFQIQLKSYPTSFLQYRFQVVRSCTRLKF